MERIATLLPTGPTDPLVHRGARRLSTRYPLNADVRVLAPVESKGLVLNASAGGLRVTLDRPVHEGDELDLEVRFGRDRSSIERARIVWSRQLPDGWIAGLMFLAA